MPKQDKTDMNVSLQTKAQSAAALLPPLLIEAERVAATVHQGAHGRRRVGVGETFWQFRRYESGDPVERIDWRQSARTDKLFIREREWEAAQTACLWADTSGSMQYASSKNLPTKAERAQVLMLALASLVLRGGEKVTWLGHRPIVAHGPNGLNIIAADLTPETGASMPPQVPIARHADVILCSDFLMPPDDLTRLLHGYAAQNIRSIFVHVIDPIENSFNLDGRLLLDGCEDEVPLLLQNAAATRDVYLQQMAQHKANLKRLAQSAGGFYVSHVTDQKPHEALLSLYTQLA